MTEHGRTLSNIARLLDKYAVFRHKGVGKIYWKRGRSAGIFRAQKKSTPRDFSKQKNSVPRDFLNQKNSAPSDFFKQKKSAPRDLRSLKKVKARDNYV